MTSSWSRFFAGTCAVLLLMGVLYHVQTGSSKALSARELVDKKMVRSLKESTAHVVGNDGKGPFPLGMCEGDCDNDSECKGKDLICYQRDPGDDAPGCYLDHRRRQSRADFCVRKAPPGGSSKHDNTDSGSGSIGKEKFALKLYWEEGYFWQEERIHRRWCMQCAHQRCRVGNNVLIVRCHQDTPTQFRFVHYDTAGREVQIRVSDQPLCMEANAATNEIFLAACNPSEDGQRFISQGGNFLNSYRFEIVPKTKPGWCLTQRHHPKMNEKIKIERCVPTRVRDDTSYWIKY